MNNLKKHLGNVFTIISFALILSCGGGGSDPEPVPVPILNPEQALLVFPDNNSECTTGVEVSETESKITFDWQKAANTTSYKLIVKNLETNNTAEYAAVTDKFEVTISRGAPYSWYVVSNSNKTETTATSETWKFYVAGKGVENYVPFPAELTSPANAASLSTTSVTLEWTGSDVDYDIKEYDVYLDTTANPTTKVATVTNSKIENQVVVSGNTYYWKIVTKDEFGNASISKTFSFSVD